VVKKLFPGDCTRGGNSVFTILAFKKLLNEGEIVSVVGLFEHFKIDRVHDEHFAILLQTKMTLMYKQEIIRLL
jgi:hypothetical protein